MPSPRFACEPHRGQPEPGRTQRQAICSSSSYWNPCPYAVHARREATGWNASVHGLHVHEIVSCLLIELRPLFASRVEGRARPKACA